MKTEIIEILSRQFDKPTTENKRFFIQNLIDQLNANGFDVDREVSHSCLGNAKINFKISKDDYSCYIELDNKSPRVRSIERVSILNKSNVDAFILLRNSFRNNYKLLGIDVISARA